VVACLIAAEGGAAEVIRRNLEGSGLYPGWVFETCSGVDEMLSRARAGDVDVLVVSAYLQPANPAGFLKDIILAFGGSQVVLLAGEACERQRAFVRAAQEMGFTNIVTGKLPGDRPNTIFAALRRAEAELSAGESVPVSEKKARRTGTVPGAAVSSEAGERRKQPASGLPEAAVFRGTDHEHEMEKEPAVEDSTAIALREAVNAGSAEEIRDRLREILAMLEGGGGLENRAVERTGPPGKGVLVITAANKGGVGKTTVAVTLSVALSRSGIPTCLIDYDLESPNVARWLGIKDVEGIEAVAGKPVRPNLLREYICERHGLDVLPGPMTPAMPRFAKGQLVEIVETLRGMYPVVVCDTPPGYWTKPWLSDVFALADCVLAVVDQSVLSEYDTVAYAPYLISMGVTPEKIGIVLNRFSPKLHSPRKVEKMFCSGFKKGLKNLPRVRAVIPNDWDAHVLSGYKGDVAGLDDVHSQWHRLAAEIAGLAGYEYRQEKKEKAKRRFSLLRREK